MERRLSMKKLVYVGLAALIASSAFAAFAPDALTAGGTPGGGAENNDTIGSVIRSFFMTSTSQPYALGIFRDSSYVYGIGYSSGTDYLLRFTATGSSAGSVTIPGCATPRGADKSHLGNGYLCLVDPANRLYVYRTSGGSPVTSFSASGSPWAMNVFWDGTYYCTNGYSNRGIYYRYTSSGSSAGTWSCSGWPSSMTYNGGAAFAQRGNNSTGPYFVACSWSSGQPMVMTTYPAGSLVRTWSMPSSNGNGLCYGDSSSPSTYGAAVWANWYTGSLYAYEIDIDARGGSSVKPTSLGKVKSLYR
jgi:hypothetical protein